MLCLYIVYLYCTLVVQCRSTHLCYILQKQSSIAVTFISSSYQSHILSFQHTISSRDSNTHSLLPFSCTYDHHRKPTKSLPVIFFTVQKSNARRIMQVTKWTMKLLVNHPPKRYINRASDCNYNTIQYNTTEYTITHGKDWDKINPHDPLNILKYKSIKGE